MKKENKAAALAFGICFGAGALIGGVGAAEVSDDLQPDIAQLNEDITQLEGSLLDADLSADRLEVNLGEVCLTALSDYGPDGPLADTSENITVEDLLAEPGTPCGDSPREVRANTREYLAAVTAVPEGQTRVTEMEANRDHLQAELDSLAEIPVGVLVGGVFGSFVGVFAAMLTNLEVSSRQRRREYEERWSRR